MNAFPFTKWDVLGCCIVGYAIVALTVGYLIYFFWSRS